MGLSRKRFFSDITGVINPEERDIETAVANILSIMNGADIIRVHNVEAARRSILVYQQLS